MPELWRPIPGYEGRYWISDYGRIYTPARMVHYIDGRSSWFRPARFLSPTSDAYGYVRIGLTDDRGVRRIQRISRLVMAVFVGPCPDGMEVLHWDDDRKNNRLSNLRYGTRSENMHDKVRNGRHHQRNKTHCVRGHVFDANNTGWDKRGCRVCRACKRIAQREVRERKKGCAA